MSRDVLADLQDASYAGLPFYVERDGTRGGRRLAIHEFYGRDDPYIEDLGAEPVHYELTAYVVGDAYDSDADAIQAAFLSEGPAILVLPVDGQVLARLQTFDRDRSLDRSGYIGFRAHFVREGQGGALVSAPYLGQIAYDAVAGLAALSDLALRRLDVVARPGWIASQAIAGLSDIVAGLDTIRAVSPVDPAKAPQIVADLAATYAALPSLVDPVAGLDASLAPRLVGLAIALADALPPAVAATQFAAAFDNVFDPLPVDPQRAQSAVLATANDAAIADTARVVTLAGAVEGLIGVTFAGRPEAITARAEIVERFATALAGADGGDQIDLYVGLQTLRGRITDLLSSRIIDATPIVTVTSSRELPSLWWAWRLYLDPARAADLIARNDVKHPSYMPESFEAMAPAVATILPKAA